MRTARINGASILKKLDKPVKAEIKRKYLPKIQRVAAAANKKLLREFLEHEITREISMGPDAPNISGTLSGYGNLFSFIGFESGDDPIGPIVDYLSDSIKIRAIIETGKKFNVIFRISLPSKEEIEQISELPWADRSWVFAMEQGLSGLGQYLHDTYGFESSRSETGIQIRGNIEDRGTFKNQAYMSEMLRNIAKYIVTSIRTV